MQPVLRGSKPTIHASLVAPSGRYLARRGGDPRPLYARFGWESEDIDAGRTRVPLGDFFAFLDAAALSVGDAHFGLHVWEDFDFCDLGLLGFALLSSDNVGAALRTLMRYGGIFQDCDAGELIVDGAHAHVLYRVSPCALPLSRHDCDMSTAFNVFLLRKILGLAWCPQAVHLQPAQPPEALLAEYERVFGSQPLFGSATNQIIFERAVLDQPIQSSDKRLYVIIEQNLRLLQEQSRLEGSLAQRIESALLPRLASGPPSLAETAAAMQLTPRALQRQLAAHRLRFSEIVDRARFGLATRLLATTGYSLAEITYLVGFSEESAFIRAFRRMLGCTPLDYRRSIHALPGGGTADRALRPTADLLRF
jgi:AraC-like DNA-binding protein